MTLHTFLIVITGVLLNAFAQLSLKAGTNQIGEISLKVNSIYEILLKVGFQPFILLGLSLYVFSVAIWIIALSKVPVSIAYPMLSIGYIVNLFLAYLLFGELITGQKILGITVIIIGVYILAKA